MDLFTFIRHSDPTKVRIGERDFAERKIKLLKMTEGRTVSLDPPVTADLGDSGDSIDKLFDEGNDAGQEHSVEMDDDVLEEIVAKGASEVVGEKTKKKRKRKVVGDASGPTFPPKKLREDYHAGASGTGGKSLNTIRELVPDGSSVPPTPDDGQRIPSPAKDVLMTIVVVTTTVTADASIVLPPRVSVVSKNLKIVADSTSASGVHADNLTNDSVLDDPYVCRDLTDRLAPPSMFAQQRAMDYDQLYYEFNVGAAWQVCLGAEVRMWAKHTLKMKGELEDKCAEQAALLSERDIISPVVPHKLLNMGSRYSCHRFIFYPFGEIINCHYQKLDFIGTLREGSNYVNPPLVKWPWICDGC
nr:hypothetical protein [Tanacetum cinerariifolium]